MAEDPSAVSPTRISSPDVAWPNQKRGTRGSLIRQKIRNAYDDESLNFLLHETFAKCEKSSKIFLLITLRAGSMIRPYPGGHSAFEVLCAD